MSDMKQRQYDALVTAIHTVVLEPNRWEGILKRISDSVDAGAGAFYFCEKATGNPGQWHLDERDDVGLKSYPESLASVDPWTILAAKATVGHWLCDTAFFEDSHINGGQRGKAKATARRVVASRAFEDGANYALVGFSRNTQAPAFSEADTEFLTRLSPHLELACRLSSEFSRLRVQAAIARQALDRLATPLWVVDSDGVVLFANHAAESGLPGIALRNGKLVPGNAALAARLSALLVRATGPKPLSGALALEQGDSPRQTVMVAPLPADSPLAADWHRPLALLMAHNPTATDAQPLDVLTALYGLSPAECRLSSLMLEGCTLTEASERLEVQVSTVRTQLKSIFWKTGTHRQGELLKLLSGALLLKA
jgi:DNA-binding CsgD family transcriptional regulator/PAS domain-containing protein